jgi:hypothetical protein
MKKLDLTRSLGLVCLSAVLLTGNGYPQITINSNEWPTTFGFGWIESVTANESGTGVPINLGSTGGPQTWTFSNGVFTESYERIYTIIDPAVSPYAGSFPDADHVWHIYHDDGEAVFDLYNYMGKTATGLFIHGLAGTAGSYPIVAECVPYDQKAAFPATLGTAWNSDYTRAWEPAAGTTIEQVFQDTWIVDAWGTINLPIGTFNCLRGRLDQTETENIYSNSVLVTTNTIDRIMYLWYTENQGLLATVTSLDNETNPNFTLADEVTFQKSTTSVDDHNGQDVRSFQLDQNFPNPFNPETSIHFYLSRDADIRLDILDLTGRRIETLASGRLTQGDHTFHFKAKELPSGMYLYRLSGSGIRLTRRMLLLK